MVIFNKQTCPPTDVLLFRVLFNKIQICLYLPLDESAVKLCFPLCCDVEFKVVLPSLSNKMKKIPIIVRNNGFFL